MFTRQNIITISIGAFILFIVFNCCFSNTHTQTSQNETIVEAERMASEASRKSAWLIPRVNSVKTVDFYLRDGDLISGKLVWEDRNKITVERLDESRIVTSTYSKREVDTRTVRTRTMPEARYYTELAEYFVGRTWDFRDDPDDFIQAIRCYEKAKWSLEQAQIQDSEKIEQINQSLEQLQADRQVWIREVESRAKLRKLEFEAMIETRFKELEDKVDESSQQVNKSIADIKDDYDKLQESVSELNKNLTRQLDTLDSRIELNRRLINRIDYTRYYHPWRYYPRR